MKVSLLIPTIKPEIKMLHSNDWRMYATQFLSTQTKGLSKARNELASRADGEILVFADDDATMTMEGWELATSIRPNEICMAEGTIHPISRVMSVHAETFWDIGGFDESIIYNGEDLDFYLRALRNHKVIVIPKEHVLHTDHTTRQPYRCQFEAAYVRVKHGMIKPSFFIQKNPITSLLRLFGFCYAMLTFQKPPPNAHEHTLEKPSLLDGEIGPNSVEPLTSQDLPDIVEIDH